MGDPACDLAIAWTFFEGNSREAFRRAINVDAGTWARGRGWALWKALIVVAQLPGTTSDPAEIERSQGVIDDLLHE